MALKVFTGVNQLGKAGRSLPESDSSALILELPPRDQNLDHRKCGNQSDSNSGGADRGPTNSLLPMLKG